MTATPRLHSIQLLRAVAVLGVVTFHAFQWEAMDFEVGAAGVDLFFIISGFIIWTVTAGRDVNPLAFLRRRAARVAPLYWLATLVAMAVVAVLPGAISHIETEPVHVVLSLLMLPHLDGRGYPFPVLDVGWTLVYEAFFYLVFAFALVMEEAERAWLITIVMIGTVMLGVSIPPLYLLGANLLVLEFAAGVWLARAWQTKRLPNLAISLLLLALGFGAIGAQHLMHFKSDMWRAFFWGLPALAIAAGALGVEAAGRLPRWRWLEALGDASYSIYLTHTLVAPLVAWRIGFQKPLLLILLVIVLGVGAGLAVRRWIEVPLLRLFGALPKKPPLIPAKAGIS